jgi:hypothetical protein
MLTPSGCTFTEAILKLPTPWTKKSGRPILFWALPKHPNYMIVYNPHARPLAILRVLYGMRDLKRLLKS